jgi:predicted esterase
MEISRKRFVETMAGGSALLLFHGCGGGGSSYGGAPAPAPAPSPAPASGCSPDILGNHGHVLTIPQSDLDLTTAKTYDIHGTANHTHSVTFSAAQLAQLKAGTTVTVTSTTAEGHEHQVSVTCVP